MLLHWSPCLFLEGSVTPSSSQTFQGEAENFTADVSILFRCSFEYSPFLFLFPLFFSPSFFYLIWMRFCSYSAAETRAWWKAMLNKITIMYTTYSILSFGCFFLNNAYSSQQKSKLLSLQRVCNYKWRVNLGLCVLVSSHRLILPVRTRFVLNFLRSWKNAFKRYLHWDFGFLELCFEMNQAGESLSWPMVDQHCVGQRGQILSPMASKTWFL